MPTTVGFIGLGNIGEPMARHLPARFETLVYDLRSEAMARLVEAGAVAADSCRALAARCDVIGVCVLDDAGTRSVVAGEDGLLAEARPGTVIAIHGTIHPQTAIELAEAARAHRVDLIDAQITGGAAGARAATLNTMVGGDPGAIERARPYLAAFSRQLTVCGQVGDAAKAKLCNNIVVYSFYHAVAEASDLATSLGLEHDAFCEILSWIPEPTLQGVKLRRAVIEEGPNHEAIRSSLEAAVGLSLKDLGHALEVAGDVGCKLPGAELCRSRMPYVFGTEREG